MTEDLIIRVVDGKDLTIRSENLMSTTGITEVMIRKLAQYYHGRSIELVEPEISGSHRSVLEVKRY